MNLRDFAGKHARAVLIGLVLLIMLAGGFVASTLSGSGTTRSKDAKAFYSADDGASWFEDSISRIPPFDHDGKQAVRAYVFKTTNGKTFVGYLQRYTEAGKKSLAESTAGPMPVSGMEVKKPGPNNKWVVQATKAGSEAAKVIAPDNSATVEPISP